MLCKAGEMDRGTAGDGLVESVAAELPLCDRATARMGSQRANIRLVMCMLVVVRCLRCVDATWLK